MAGECVDEIIIFATAFGCGGQKRFQKPPLVVAERCVQGGQHRKTISATRQIWFRKTNTP
jgi:hypothetical protein